MREIHRLRRHARDLQDRIEQGPRQLRAQQGRVAREEEALREGQDGIKRLKVSIHEQEGNLKSTHQQIKKYEKQLEESTSRKEYDALQAEIAEAHRKNRKTEDGILEGMLEMEERTARLPDLEKAVQQAKAELARAEAEAGARQAELTEMHRQTLAQVTEVENTLPGGDVRAQYERQVKARGEDALSAVESRTCMACYTEITAEQSNQLQREQLVFCKNCGRILYLPA
jgi:predicted  nucleic acid-binding Zn-ribbon protein